jgi:hypothetical protein
LKVKLSDPHPCDAFRSPLKLSFNIVRHSGALVVAEAMAPAADQAVLVFRAEDRQLQTELLCHECFGSRLADLVERQAQEA